MVLVLILAAIGCALVKHESTEETVLRSNGRVATVHTHWLRWRRWGMQKKTGPRMIPRFTLGEPGSYFATLVSITDDEHIYWCWARQYQRPVMLLDVAGGYALASSRYAPRPACYTIGPRDFQRGLPKDLPLRRCVQNLGFTDWDREMLANFEPSMENNQLACPTARIWLELRRGALSNDTPQEKVKEIQRIHQTEFGGERNLLKSQLLGTNDALTEPQHAPR